MISPLFSNTNKKFNIIILAAGKGTRLKPATDYIAKPLISLGKERAIDYLIKKYQYISDKIIVAVGYESDLLENYIKGKYSSLNISFSKENVEELKGPGRSLIYALDYADSHYPTIITFCDYIVNDVFSVENNAVCVCEENNKSILGDYQTSIVADEGIAVKLRDNVKSIKTLGFTGIIICHDTLLLKSIVYRYASSNLNPIYEDYIKDYIDKVKTNVIILKEIYDFGDEKTLEQTRSRLNGCIG